MIDTNAVLLGLAKAIDKSSPRIYAQVIGIKNNRAYVTDGYSLIRWCPEYSIGPDRSLSPSLNDSSVNYPNVESVFPTTEGTTLEAPDRLDALLKVLKPSWHDTPVVLQIDGQSLSLVPHEEKKQHPGVIFNLRLLVQCAKGMPKNATCLKATLSDCQEKLTLEFDTPSGKYEILLVAMRQ